MKIHRSFSLAAMGAVSLGLSGLASAATINLNMGTATASKNTPGGALSGVVNNVPLGSSLIIVDSAGVDTGVSALVGFEWSGDNNNDPDAKFDSAATTYTDAVARSLFWGGAAPTVTIEGLSANTDYAVGIVAASNTSVTHDWFINGTQVADDLEESEGQSAVPYFLGTTNSFGDLVILTNDHQGGVALLQALVIDDDLTLIPEPGSLALMGLGGLLILRRRPS